MSIAVRYYSRSGHTKALAEAIGEGVNTPAISIDSPEAMINEEVDVLFIGGALYAYGIDKKLKAYIESLDASKIKKAVVFSTSWLSKHSIDLIKKALQEKNIPVEEETCYAKNMPSDAQLSQAKEFAKRMV